MGARVAITFDKKTRRAVAAASDGLPDIGTWLTRIHAIGHESLDTAIDGIWCGRDGEARIPIGGANAMLCVGWYNKRVEWSYLS